MARAGEAASRSGLRAIRFGAPGLVPLPGAENAVEHLGVIDREASWLEFNQRVLKLAAAPDLPLLERVKYLAIAAHNFDEMFLVKIPTRNRARAAGGPTPDITLSALELRALIDDAVSDQYATWRRLAGELAANSVNVIPCGAVLGTDDPDVSAVERTFDRLVPALRPVWLRAIDVMPHIPSRAVYLAALAEDRGDSLVLLRLPPLVARLVEIGDGRFAYIEDIIRAHAGLFRLDAATLHTFRVIRDATLAIDKGAAFRAAMEWQLHQRDFGAVTRLEVPATMPDRLVDVLRRRLNVAAGDLCVLDGPLDLSHVMQIAQLPRPDLREAPTTPVTPSRCCEPATSMFSRLRAGDILVHHPYESFDDSVTALVRAATDDARVTDIKHTLYRTSNDSPIVAALRDAARAGKTVQVIVEPKARFDERANLAWARRMERDGVNVHFGAANLKVHAKLALIRRVESEGSRWYWHTGTGNYNPETARIYEDISLLSADAIVGDALNSVFDAAMLKADPPPSHPDVIAAPWHLRDRLRTQIHQQRELGAEGRIVVKANALTDPLVIADLYEAARDRVAVHLVIRGTCCLRPGVPEQSETITVRSIVGRYLEHSRIWRFGSGDGAAFFIGSADLMPRNLDRRVEVMVAVHDPALRARLTDTLAVLLADDVRAWELGRDGWQPPTGRVGIEAHRALHGLATRDH